VNTEGSSAAQQVVDNLWLRVGRSNKKLLKAIETFYPNRGTIEMLAAKVNRKKSSVRSSMNSALKRAINSATAAVPSAPDVLDWNKRQNDGLWEVGYSPDIMAAMATKTVDSFDSIPRWSSWGRPSVRYVITREKKA